MPNLLGDSLLNFENHKSLRTLKLDAGNLSTWLAREAGILKTLLSSIKCPQLVVVLVYCGDHLSHGRRYQWEYDEETNAYVWKSEKLNVYGCQECQQQWGLLFGVLGEIQRAREFRLVLCVEGESEEVVEDATRALEHCVELHRREELHSLLTDSLITSETPCWDDFNITKVEWW